MSRSKHKNSGNVAGVTIHDIGNGKGIFFIWGGIVSFWGTGPECREYMKVAAAIQNSGQCYHVIEDKKKRVTTQTSLDNFLKRLDRIESSKGTRTCFIKVRYEWNCNLPSVCYCWQSFSSTISHLLSLLQSVQFSSVQSLSRVWLFRTPWIAARQASLSNTNSRSSLRLTSIESVMPSSHLILCHPLLLLPPNPPSIKVFSNEPTLPMGWPTYWSFSFSIIPSKEIPGLISFRIDWLDLLAVQGTLKSLLQHHSSKASILQHSAFFTVQLSHPYMTTGKTITLTRWTFVGKVMSLVLNMLSWHRVPTTLIISYVIGACDTEPLNPLKFSEW